MCQSRPAIKHKDSSWSNLNTAVTPDLSHPEKVAEEMESDLRGRQQDHQQHLRVLYNIKTGHGLLAWTH
jgi:hypothetical protein